MVGDGNRATREEMERVIRRLDVLEYLILAVAAVLALGGGALAAFLAKDALGAPFRPVWIGASIILFVVPGIIVIRRERRTDSPPGSGSGPPAPSEEGESTGSVNEDRTRENPIDG